LGVQSSVRPVVTPKKVTPKRSSVRSPTLLDLNVHFLNLVGQTDELLDVAGSSGGDDKLRLLNSR
jgi:hypothetical protein